MQPRDHDNENRITRLEVTIENINHTLSRLESKMDSGFTHLNGRMDDGFKSLNDRMNEGFKGIDNRIWANFYWMIGGFASILMILAHAQHWI